MHLVSEFQRKGKEVCRRMRSPEGTTLSRADLQVLRDQLHVLYEDAASLLNKMETSGRE